MTTPTGSPAPPVESARRTELLELAYAYALGHGLAELSLRPLAAAVGSSPRVLLYLFGSKDGLVRALLDRARADELTLLDRVRAHGPAGLGAVTAEIWRWLAAPEHRALLVLWAQSYTRSLTGEADTGPADTGPTDTRPTDARPAAVGSTDDDGTEGGASGPWQGFAEATVDDWLGLLAEAQPPAHRRSAAGRAERTLALAVLRGALLDLLATGDTRRTTAAVTTFARALPARLPAVTVVRGE